MAAIANLLIKPETLNKASEVLILTLFLTHWSICLYAVTYVLYAYTALTPNPSPTRRGSLILFPLPLGKG